MGNNYISFCFCRQDRSVLCSTIGQNVVVVESAPSVSPPSFQCTRYSRAIHAKGYPRTLTSRALGSVRHLPSASPFLAHLSSFLDLPQLRINFYLPSSRLLSHGDDQPRSSSTLSMRTPASRLWPLHHRDHPDLPEPAGPVSRNHCVIHRIFPS